EGLAWNNRRQLVEGIVEEEGEYTYTVHVTIDGETSEETVSLTVSSTLQQPVPFMGWLSWNVVQSDISESVIRTVADAMVSQGLMDAGYKYLVIDDLWHASARQSGTNKPLPHPTKFPNGMKVCADYVHEKGLKFGIYSDAAEKTCANAYGSYGYETIDANQYAEWGVDLLKYDYCGAPSDALSAKARYKAMGDALKATGRNILFYMCEWGVREPWKWATETGATCWRATYDTRDGWNGKDGGIGIVESVAGMKDLWAYHGVNRFNDADMMCVGIHGTGKSSNDLVVKPGMTMTEYSTQFSMWCMWGSPLTLSFDLRKSITAEDLALMTNPELIAINQDRMGQAAEFVNEDGNNMQLYFKDLENGDIAVAVLNMSSAAHAYTIDFSEIPALEADTEYLVRDLVNREDLPAASNTIKLNSVASHETRVLRLSKKNGSVGISDIDASA
ncbi:MAG: glycoside hydrolase family 27 protein, partial [Muribaculaceae bacterium]|nr:glycoside hydrolase family 27 protein [Muribaculaceae bacterium]